jgi:hypothetical protein
MPILQLRIQDLPASTSSRYLRADEGLYLFQRNFRLAQPAYGYLLSNMPAALPSHGAIQKSLNTLATSI